MKDSIESRDSDQEKYADSTALLLSLLNWVIEKHGGRMEVDEINNTFTVIIAENRKAACLRDLGEILGPYETVSESSYPIH
jgi:hypothetical protein